MRILSILLTLLILIGCSQTPITTRTTNVSFEMEEGINNLKKMHYNNARLNFQNIINSGSSTDSQKASAYAGLGWTDAVEFEDFSYGITNFEKGQKDVDSKVGLVLAYLASLGIKEQELSTTSASLVTNGITLMQQVFVNSEYVYVSQFSDKITDGYMHAIFSWFLYLDNQILNAKTQIKIAREKDPTNQKIKDIYNILKEDLNLDLE